MKKYFLLFIATTAILALNAQFKADKEPFLTKSLSGEAIKNVEATTSGGSISVAGVSASEARIEVYVWPNNYNKSNGLSKEEIQKRMDEDYKLDISVSNNKLSAIAKTKDKLMNWKKFLNISFKIFVPQNVSTDLNTSGGNISLTNLSGSQNFSTSGGNLNVENVSGKIDGRTSGGNVNVKNSKDDIDLTTSGGNIDAENCNGKIHLTTSGGSLNLVGLNGDIKATTSGGNVEGHNIDGELAAHTSGGNIELSDLSCSLETSTSGGNIHVAIKEFGKFVKISNSGGNIDLQIPKNKGLDLGLYGSKIKTDTLENFSGSMDDDEVKGKLNGGGIPVTVRAGSGRISLVLR
jgi:DUF4097 and DUF4098 domain-containing protein YvlB